MEHGIRTALHMAGNSVALFSSWHYAGATENFRVIGHRTVDDAWYDELVTGVPKPEIACGAAPGTGGPANA